mmetsp:Transcript_35080/g.78080  ORF Transcript_35080/g.78080 Transcript_35080/m.78080 type:complete len:639 (+) Transcript_35080:103-2019(+)|eukprot:CAMPEP_0202891186 /NCGR_PEP_ID=MMETSP1392-20130828/1315_1 /ASSEMBLY_ACC=CAM_ASM_000868 /TAXON_ID=225041 /ORGANISM="Chlamydomonas chlamydogama, Strain SAG 11-48b" /LENGTH=638 /DNA_ID=CAMNT_0049574871 /DNA_START=90 /DNA_END=2006 /DNA_ORIENTATION=-
MRFDIGNLLRWELVMAIVACLTLLPVNVDSQTTKIQLKGTISVDTQGNIRQVQLINSVDGSKWLLLNALSVLPTLATGNIVLVDGYPVPNAAAIQVETIQLLAKQDNIRFGDLLTSKSLPPPPPPRLSWGTSPPPPLVNQPPPPPPASTTFPSSAGLGSSYEFTSITFILNMCNKAANISPEALRPLWARQWSTKPNSPTLEAYMEQCSNGKVAFNPERNKIVGPVNVPCFGRRPNGMAFSSTGCEWDDLWGWAEVADDYAKMMGIDLSLYRHKILLIPPGALSNPACGWVGMGQQSCWKLSSCVTWINAVPSEFSLNTIMHELGHNLGLQHSSYNGNEYADPTCIMGGAGGLRCFNAPQTWALGWSSPIADIDATNSIAGVWQKFVLPAQASSPVSFVRLLPGASKAGTYFIAYRSNIGYDVELCDTCRDRVTLHQYDGGSVAQGTTKPVLIAQLAATNTWPAAPQAFPGFTIKVLSTSSASATIAVCRFDVPGQCYLPAADTGSVPGPVQGVDPPSTCNYNTVCEPALGEDAISCPDCKVSGCGDGVCDADENYANCIKDCPLPVVTPSSVVVSTPRCGDGICQAYAGEDCTNCSQDCASVWARTIYCCGKGAAGNGCNDAVCFTPPYKCFMGPTI